MKHIIQELIKANHSALSTSGLNGPLGEPMTLFQKDYHKMYGPFKPIPIMQPFRVFQITHTVKFRASHVVTEVII